MYNPPPRRVLIFACICASESLALAQITVPPPLPGALTYAIAVNQSGEAAANYIKVVYESETREISFVGAYSWTGGLPNSIGAATTATAINTSGQIVGYTAPGLFSAQEAFLLDKGRMTMLGALTPGAGSQAFGINDSGQVVGCSAGEAFLWQKSTGMQALGEGCAYAINNQGQIVGASGVNRPACDLAWADAVLWTNGTPSTLSSTHICNVASAINDSGQIVGTSSDGVESAFAVLWQGGVPQILEPALYQSVATGIDSSGRVVGNVEDPSVNNEQNTPFVWQNGSITYLPTNQIPGGAAGISSSNGWVAGVVGYYTGTGAPSTAVLWKLSD